MHIGESFAAAVIDCNSSLLLEVGKLFLFHFSFHLNHRRQAAAAVEEE